MLFGSVENIFNTVQGSAEAAGGSLGALLGGGTGSAAGLASRLFQAIYAGSGQEIPPIQL